MFGFRSLALGLRSVCVSQIKRDQFNKQEIGVLVLFCLFAGLCVCYQNISEYLTSKTDFNEFQ